MVRAKFKVNSYETSLQNNEELRTVKLTAVYDGSEENKKFFKWTPNGQIQIGMLNEKAWRQFPLGAEMYVDFTPAEEEVAAMNLSQGTGQGAAGISFNVGLGPR